MQVGLLTIQQKEEIIGQQFAADCFFNPIQDFYDNWIISIQEINECINGPFMFVKNLPLIEYTPKE